MGLTGRWPGEPEIAAAAAVSLLALLLLAGGLAWRGRHQTAARPAVATAAVDSPLPGELRL